MKSRRAYALVDLVMLLVIVTAAAALLVLTTSRTRKLSSLGESLGNLRQFTTGMTSYAADNADAVYSYTWRAGVAYPSQYPDLRGPHSDDLTAAASQAVDILRRRADRPDLPRPSGWFPHPLYSHLVLADYLGVALPMRFAISPEDSQRLAWANDPAGFQQGRYQPQPSGSEMRWPYSSSYEMGAAFYSENWAVNPNSYITNSTSHSTWLITGSPFVIRRTAQVAFPSQKAFMWDSVQRHFGSRQVYFMYPEARIPIVFADGSARVRASQTANLGFDPSRYSAAFPLTLQYQPQAWEPQVPAGAGSSVTARYRFTRAGLLGRDFDGDEVPAQ